MAKSLEGVCSPLSIAATGASKPPLNIVEPQPSRLIYDGVKVSYLMVRNPRWRELGSGWTAAKR